MNTETQQLISRTYQFGRQCVTIACSLNPRFPSVKFFQSQLIRCGTSVAANYRAAYIAQSRKSFAAKLSICAEEADECVFWIQLIQDLKCSFSPPETIDHLLDESMQLTKIFVASRKTLAKGPPA